MLKQLQQIREKLEIEKSNSKKFLLSNMYYTLLVNSSEEVKKQEAKYFEQIELLLKEYQFYDFLKNDNEIYKDFYTKINKEYTKNKYKYYGLFSENKFKPSEAKELTYEILTSMGIDKFKSYERLFCFDDIKYVDLDNCMGNCYNTFNYEKPNISIDSKINKQATFLKTYLHELGHEYENTFMSTMSSIQQIDRYDYCFIEVMSCFFERVALDYLIKNDIYKDDAHRELNLNYFDLNDYAESLYKVSNMALSDKIVYDDEYAKIKEIYSLDKDNKPASFITTYYNYSNDIKYLYGLLLGEYFFDIYRKDKKEGMTMIRNFLSNQAILDEREMLDLLNLKEKDYNFLEYGINENRTYMKKRYKW